MPAGINKVSLLGVRQQLRESLWFLPGLFVAAAIALGITLAEIDDRASPDFVSFAFSDDVEAARVVLSTIAGAMVTVTALVFSVTMLVLQLASAQYSPRIIRNFLQDRTSQLALGIFAATFSYSLVTLARLDSAGVDQEEVTPALTMMGALLLVLIAVGIFVQFVHHTAQSIRVSNIVERIARETESAMTKIFPESVGGAADLPTLEPDELGPVVAKVETPHPGVLVALDAELLLKIATRTDALIALQFRVGEFVPTGAVLMKFHGNAVVEKSDLDDARRAVELGRERTMDQDAGFGIRQLIDIALRALSTGVNDPTTATQAIYRVHSLLRFLGSRGFPSEMRTDEESGVQRLLLPRPGWDDYVQLSFEELLVFGAGSPRVVEYLRLALNDLIEVVPPHRQAALRHQKRKLEDAVAAAAFSES